MNSIKNTFTIKDLENISRIKAHTIRIWEKRYGILTPNRTSTNIRYYSALSLQKLLNVVLLNKHNYKISKIAQMSDQQITTNVKELALKFAINDEAINAFKMAMFQFDKVLFNNTYNKLLHKKTFREIFKEIFLPLLQQIGLLWQANVLLPVHEHFISSLIIQKIQINTEKLEYIANNEDCMYVLFLPEGEIHEISLLYLNYELVLRGAQTVYLGENLPLNNLDYFFESKTKVCFITSMTVRPDNENIDDYFKQVDNSLKDTGHKFIAIGQKTADIKTVKFQSDIATFPSVLHFIEAI